MATGENFMRAVWQKQDAMRPICQNKELNLKIYEYQLTTMKGMRSYFKILLPTGIIKFVPALPDKKQNLWYFMYNGKRIYLNTFEVVN